MSILAGSGTRVMIQGITGREAGTLTLQLQRSGTSVVAGVTPGRGGNNVYGVPVFNTVAEAQQHASSNATIISVPALRVCEAAIEALNAGLRLLVILTERVPRRDVVKLLERARECGAIVIGPNSLGFVSPGVLRVGMVGGAVESFNRAFCKGAVGVLSRSGGMMTEIASLLTRAGIGQSTCVSIGGDSIVGMTFTDLLPLYEQDSQTRALVLFCEPGGTMEEEFAELLRHRGSRIPIAAFVAGRFTDRYQGMRFGHAAVIVNGTQGSPSRKGALLKEAGVTLAGKISEIPGIVAQMLSN